MGAKVIRSYSEFLRIYLPKKYDEMVVKRERREADRKWCIKHPVRIGG